VAEPAPPVEDDVAVAGQAIARWIGARRQGLAPLALLGSGVVAGWLLRRRPASEVAAAGGRVAAVAQQVAAAIATAERFRRPRTDAEARQRAIDERRAA
jgi:hypothetical protein